MGAYTQFLYRAEGTMGALKAVPDEPDLSEFRVGLGGPPPDRRWQQVLAELDAGDVEKLRAALLKPTILDHSIVTWLERRGICVDPRTVKGWRRRGYAAK